MSPKSRVVVVVAPTLAMALVAACGSSPSSAPSSDPNVALVPKGAVPVDTMQVPVSPQMQALADKFQAAIAKDQAWWVDYVAKTPAGEPLPYDKRMGLTEAEYKEFLSFADKGRLTRISQTTMTVKAETPSRFRFDGAKLCRN